MGSLPHLLLQVLEKTAIHLLSKIIMDRALYQCLILQELGIEQHLSADLVQTRIRTSDTSLG